MKLADLGVEAAVAVRAVGEAGRLARSIQYEAVREALTKDDRSPVTIADFTVQGIVASHLARHFPADALVAEEDAETLQTAATEAVVAQVVDSVRRARPDARRQDVLDWIDRGRGTGGHRFWTLDPIDGTEGLLHGGQYVVALALVVDGDVQVGVLGCPRVSLATGAAAGSSEGRVQQGGVALAVRGRGTWWVVPMANGDLTKLSVSAVEEPSRARVLHSREGRHGDVPRFHRVLRALGAEPAPLLMDSQAKHVFLAAGEADLLLRFPSNAGFHDAIWDQAAGSLLVQEAGGRVTDLAGRALDFTAGRRLLRNDGLIASNGLLHEAALAAVR